MMIESSINSATILPPYEEEFEPVDNLHWYSKQHLFVLDTPASSIECDFKIKDATQNQVPQTNTTLENNFFPSLFSEMVLEAGSNPIETIKHPGEFDHNVENSFIS
ncbi:hypothetical protein LOTGIDRAFT_163191 [Lottia gigantea]|uniref:Uncharacterized protein n=1 Tax=Lottia gigantea TaxID=225164 RepID=V4BSE2_LOTGI|nr:hypothetical protein LOTGIDRAFT_163191 [Lottia gigantea]ESO91829.1 hypothetical protein LOTGIDRAFT_163191 [Lottia gigantea]